MEWILKNEILVLLGIMLSGCLLGLIKIRGISFGNTACLFTGLLAGAFGATVPQIVEQIGIVFFVYSIGLSTGPRFFHLFRGRAGLNMIMLSIFTIIVGALASALGALLLNLPDGAFIGVFAGALTSTPTLASAISALAQGTGLSAAKISVAYTVTYPMGFLLIVLFVQYMPRIFSKRFKSEMEREKVKVLQRDFQTQAFSLENRNFIGKSLDEIRINRFCHVNITRVKRNSDMILVSPELKLQDGDVAVVVGLPEELSKFEIIFGKKYEKEIEPFSGMDIKDLVLASSKLAGMKLKDLKIRSLYGVTITRIRRSGRNITPHGNTILEMGDEIRVFGSTESINKFAVTAGSERKKLDETNIVILSLGMFAGLALGFIPFHLGGVTLSLGVVGGPLLVALLMGHFGKIGRWSVRLPIATRMFLREFGLVFFLSSIGVSSGAKLAGAMHGTDILLIFLLGIVVALITMIASYFVAAKVFSMSVGDSLGAICGSMTSTPALGVLINKIDDESPTLAYAAVYPIATILLTVSGQIFVWMDVIIKAVI